MGRTHIFDRLLGKRAIRVNSSEHLPCSKRYIIWIWLELRMPVTAACVLSFLHAVIVDKVWFGLWRVHHRIVNRNSGVSWQGCGMKNCTMQRNFGWCNWRVRCDSLNLKAVQKHAAFNAGTDRMLTVDLVYDSIILCPIGQPFYISRIYLVVNLVTIGRSQGYGHFSHANPCQKGRVDITLCIRRVTLTQPNSVPVLLLVRNMRLDREQDYFSLHEPYKLLQLMLEASFKAVRVVALTS